MIARSALRSGGGQFPASLASQRPTQRIEHLRAAFSENG